MNTLTHTHTHTWSLLTTCRRTREGHSVLLKLSNKGVRKRHCCFKHCQTACFYSSSVNSAVCVTYVLRRQSICSPLVRRLWEQTRRLWRRAGSLSRKSECWWPVLKRGLEMKRSGLKLCHEAKPYWRCPVQCFCFVNKLLTLVHPINRTMGVCFHFAVICSSPPAMTRFFGAVCALQLVYTFKPKSKHGASHTSVNTLNNSEDCPGFASRSSRTTIVKVSVHKHKERY